MVWTWPLRRNWSLLDEVNRLAREMEFLSGPRTPAGHRGLDEFPTVNIWTNDENALLTAEIAGIDPQQIDVSVKDAAVTIRGSREPEALSEGEVFVRQERGAGSFVRSFTLPFRIDSERVEARYQTGILQLTLPKSEADKPKKITVNAG